MHLINWVGSMSRTFIRNKEIEKNNGRIENDREDNDKDKRMRGQVNRRYIYTKIDVSWRDRTQEEWKDEQMKGHRR